MESDAIKESIDKLRERFNSGVTKPPKHRKENLRKLLKAIYYHEQEIVQAISSDFKSRSEVLQEVRYIISQCVKSIKKIDQWIKPKSFNDKKWFELFDSTFLSPEPLGVVAIISPWNFPVALTFDPLIGALAAGNCCIVKPSEVVESTAIILTKVLESAFDSKEVLVLNGGPDITKSIIENNKLDHVFFTGSTMVGKEIMKMSAKQICPVTLELGGKCPVVVLKDADLLMTAKRIVFGKMLNSGQICVSPDYILCERSVFKDLIKALVDAANSMIGSFEEYEANDITRIVNLKHFERLKTLIQEASNIIGGKYQENSRRIEFTLIKDPSHDSQIMKEEIFGPILPVISFETKDEAISFINQREKPLTLYLFTKNATDIQSFERKTSSGSLVINDTFMQLLSNSPFGGIGASGIGKYHGDASFECFSHYKTVTRKPSEWFEPINDLSGRYSKSYEKSAALTELLFGYPNASEIESGKFGIGFSSFVISLWKILSEAKQ